MGLIFLQVKNKEPSLCDLETRLQERILAAQETCIPTREQLRKKQGQDGKNRWVGKTFFGKLKCTLCENKHLFYKCDKYEKMTGTERMKLVKEEKLCFNCLKRNHNADKCTSKNAFIQVVQNIIIIHYMTTSRKKLMRLMRRTQRYAYLKLQNTKQCSFRLYQLK